MAYPNKFSGRCLTCRQAVAVGEGFVLRNEAGKWDTYCRAHFPERIDPPAPQVNRVLTADGKVITPYEKDNLDLYRAMPGSRWDGEEKCWRVSLADGDRARLLELADRLKLEVAPQLRQIVVSEQANNAHHAGLYHFQVDGVDWLAKREKALLADDMGLGKTIQSLVALPERAATVVVVPASLKGNWEAECKKWRPDLKPIILNGRGTFRLPLDGELIIVNYELLPDWLKPEKRTESSPAWDVEVKLPLSTRDHARKCIVIVDECHRCKNGKTARAQRVAGLCMIAGVVWGLTGTPLENRPMDLYGTLRCLGFSHLVFGTFARFLERMNGAKDSWGGYVFGTPQPIVPELMRRVMLRRRREVVLPDLPRKTISTVVCDIPEDLRSDLDEMVEEFWGGAEEMEKDSELPPFEEFSSMRARLAASRIDTLTEMVEDCEEADVPLVVFSAHLEPVRKIGKRDGWATIDGSTPSAKRTQIVADFQAGKLKGVAATIRAGGVGLTLTRAWKAIFVDLDWVPSQNQQAEDRICRIGQLAKKVEIVRLVSDHVLDKHVLKLIAWKIAIIEAALEKTVQSVQVAGVTIHRGESEEEFAARILAAQVIAEALAEDRDPEEVNTPKVEWPKIQLDNDIPF